MEATLANDVDIAASLEIVLPTKSAKWSSWAQILRDAGINTVGDVRKMSPDAWNALNLSPVLKSGVGLLRESSDAADTPSEPTSQSSSSSSSSSPTVTNTSSSEDNTSAVPNSSSDASTCSVIASTTSTPSTTAAATSSVAAPSSTSALPEVPATPVTPATRESEARSSEASSRASRGSDASLERASGASLAGTGRVSGASVSGTRRNSNSSLNGSARGSLPASSIALTDNMKRTPTEKIIHDNLKIGRLPAIVALLHREAVHFSGMVSKINGSGRAQARALIITEKAVYNCLEKTYVIKRRIPFESIAALTVSRGSGEFVIHVPFEYDYHYSGVFKEDVQVTLNWSFEQFAANFPGDIRDNQTHLMTNFTADSKLADRVMTEERSKTMTKADRETRWVSLQTPCLPSDHLHFSALPPIRRLIRELGDSNPKPEEVRFSAYVQKVNKKGLNQTRVFLVTDKAVYNILQAKGDEYKCQRRIGFHEIAAMTMSTQPQSTEFVLHLAKDYDYHFLSPYKVEIKEVLAREFLAYAAQHGSKFSMSQSALAVALKAEGRLREYVLTKEMAAQMDEKLRQKRMRDIVLNANMAAAKAEAEAALAAQKMAETK